LILPLYGCRVQESYLDKTFPAELAKKARSDFNVDLTDWTIDAGKPIPSRAHLVFQKESGIDSTVQAFCQEKLTKNLIARGIKLDPNEPAELIVCIVKVSEIKQPVRSAKIRITAKLSITGSSDPILLGIADGIDPRPDLSSGVWMPKSSYLRAAQHAISKLMLQLDNMPKAKL
jgi:hypothetical protein